MVGGFFGATQMNAQTNPCGWTLLNRVENPFCTGNCEGSILVTPNINLPNVTYLWNTGSQSSFISGLCAETYVVTVTDPEGCSQVFSYDVVDPLPLVVTCTTTVNESAPGAADGVITANVSGGWGPYEFEWLTNPVQYGQTLSGLTAGSYTVRVWDDKKCLAETTCEVITEEKEECNGFRTQTQGGWGQCDQHGNNVATYLFANFDAAFPSDLTIGCGTKKLKLTSAQAVCDFLPSGTQARALNNGTLVDPGQTYRNVFAGQLVAATLNVGFDLYDANFGVSNINLGDLIIESGPLAGLTVK